MHTKYIELSLIHLEKEAAILLLKHENLEFCH